MLRTAAISAALILVAGVSALYFFGRDRTFAVTELDQAPVHLRIVDGPLESEADCAARLQAVANAMVRNCPQCRPVQSCPTRIDAELTAVLGDKKLDMPYVRVGSMREIVKAPPPAAHQVCQAIVTAMTAQGNNAECVEP